MRCCELGGTDVESWRSRNSVGEGSWSVFAEGHSEEVSPTALGSIDVF